jgi:hypothetical protein
VSVVAVVRTMPPNMWGCVGGVWVHITALDDPLLRAELHRVTVHHDDQVIWAEVDGANAGVRLQTTEPNEHDFASFNGEPL